MEFICSAGIFGEEMSFTKSEKNDAPAASQQFFIQNVGVLGNVSDSASVTNAQAAEITGSVEPVRNLLREIEKIFSMLPVEIQKQLAPLTDQTAKVVNSSSPDKKKLAALLGSIRKVCEDVSGSVITQGIVHLASAILG